MNQITKKKKFEFKTNNDFLKSGFKTEHKKI